MKRQEQLAMAARLRAIREFLDGQYGAQFLADDLGIPLKTWLNYESEVTLPGDIALQLVVMAGVNAAWLLTGEGSMCDRCARDAVPDGHVS